MIGGHPLQTLANKMKSKRCCVKNCKGECKSKTQKSKKKRRNNYSYSNQGEDEEEEDRDDFMPGPWRSDSGNSFDLQIKRLPLMSSFSSGSPLDAYSKAKNSLLRSGSSEAAGLATQRWSSIIVGGIAAPPQPPPPSSETC